MSYDATEKIGAHKKIAKIGEMKRRCVRSSISQELVGQEGKKCRKFNEYIAEI